MWPDPLRSFEGSATDPAYLYLELAAERAVSPVNGELADIRVHPRHRGNRGGGRPSLTFVITPRLATP